LPIVSLKEEKIISLQSRKEEVLSSVHTVDWTIFRTRKTLDKIKAGAKSNDRDIPAEFEQARESLARSQEQFQNLRRSVTKPGNPYKAAAVRLR